MCPNKRRAQQRSRVAEPSRWLTHVTKKEQNKLMEIHGCPGSNYSPRKPDCTCSCVCVCVCVNVHVWLSCVWLFVIPVLGIPQNPCVLPGISPFHKRTPRSFSSKHKTKKQESMRLSQGVSTFVLFFTSGTCERFLLHGNKDEFISITTTHLTFSVLLLLLSRFSRVRLCVTP